MKIYRKESDTKFSEISGFTSTECGTNQGINLLTGTKNFTGDWGFLNFWTEEVETYQGFKVFSTTLQWFGIHKIISAIKGQTYTFSCYAKAEQDVLCQIAFVNNEKVDAAIFTVGTEWKQYSGTFTASEDSNINVQFEKRADDSTTKICVCGYKLEYGENKNPVWTPSLLDDFEEEPIFYSSVIINSSNGYFKDGLVINQCPNGPAGIFIGAPYGTKDEPGLQAFLISTDRKADNKNLRIAFGENANIAGKRTEITDDGKLIIPGLQFGSQMITNIECGNGTLVFDSISTGAVTSMSITFRNGDVGAGTWRVIASIENVSITLSISAISNNGFVLTARRINENIQDLFNFQWIAIKAED